MYRPDCIKPTWAVGGVEILVCKKIKRQHYTTSDHQSFETTAELFSQLFFSIDHQLKYCISPITKRQ